ncbi:SIS domain-containing protein [Kineosporia sp. J2-2]|uniref:SIS domain-containing protein n=1 Tax=Kineosporia corallincola TaxID=2835133 RepID=A0ABS5TDN2_9ACTN|nr:SIS domain-containing protein [Kineosporia corallincola]MBT0769165.1 SIS domain-containing protein [Kineosporia corallincola]
MTTFVDAEIASQPEVWKLAGELVHTVSNDLPRRGERVAVVGCGTSWFIAASYAVLREAAGDGVTDAFAGSEYPAGREYDRVVAISRSGTTTEIIELLRELATPSTLITAVPDAPAARHADATVGMPFADEQSVVQTRFATSALTLLRCSLGNAPVLDDLVRDGRVALEIPVDDLLGADQVTFLGRGWTIGLASEAGLKTREAAQFWAESYPAMDYRHGPIAIAQPGRLVWSFGPVPEGLTDDVAATGATFVHHDLDPQAALVVAQRFAIGLAQARGLDPDNPRSLTRSVILS